MCWPRERASLRGLRPFLILCLALHFSLCYAAVTSSNGDLDDRSPADAPSPLLEGASNTTQDTNGASGGRQGNDFIRPQQNVTLVFVVGIGICLVIFALSYCIAYKTIMARQGQMVRLHRSRVRGIELEEQDFDLGAGREDSGGHGGLDPSLVSSLRTVQYSSGLLKEKEMMKTPAEGGHPLQEHDKEMIMWVKECAVCLAEFEEGEDMKVLPVYGHCFHETCINMWLFSHTTCPICRLSLLKLPPADRAMAAPPSPDSQRAPHVAVGIQFS